MKGFALVFICLIVGTYANPTIPDLLGKDLMDERLVTGNIKKAIEEASQDIRDAGLDPFELDEAFDYELPVPVIFSINAFVDSLVFTGLSNIVVNRMNYSVITNRLTFNISLPRLSLHVPNSGFATIFLGDNINGSLSGTLNVIQPRIVGNVRISIGIISGISVRRITLVFSLDRIESNLNLKLFDFDLSDTVNIYLGRTLPGKINQFAAPINELFEIIAWHFVNK